jgi:hypothetical protein
MSYGNCGRGEENNLLPLVVKERLDCSTEKSHYKIYFEVFRFQVLTFAKNKQLLQFYLKIIEKNGLNVNQIVSIGK